MPCTRTPIPEDPRYGDMLALRATGLTMAAIGARYGISRERVRQIIGNHGRVGPRDLTGKTHYRLTCIAGKSDPITVQCRCGTVKVITRSGFSQESVKSCGCYHREVVGKLNRKLTDADVRKMRRWRAQGWTLRALASHFNIHPAYAWTVVTAWRGRRAVA